MCTQSHIADFVEHAHRTVLYQTRRTHTSQYAQFAVDSTRLQQQCWLALKTKVPKPQQSTIVALLQLQHCIDTD